MDIDSDTWPTQYSLPLRGRVRVGPLSSNVLSSQTNANKLLLAFSNVPLPSSPLQGEVGAPARAEGFIVTPYSAILKWW